MPTAARAVLAARRGGCFFIRLLDNGVVGVAIREV